jgi:hypothetical protein
MLPQIQNKVISKKGIVSTKPKLNCWINSYWIRKN